MSIYESLRAAAVARGAARAAGTPTSPGGDAGAQTQMQIKILDAQIRRAHAQRNVLNEQMKRLKGKKDRASKLKLNALQGRRDALDAHLEMYTKKRSATQNKYYESTGQYDKLLKGENRDAFLALNSLFTQYGLGSLAGKIYDYVKNGYGSDTISILLQDTPEYKKRFSANEARLKAGLPVLSPAEYLSTEESYRQIMRQSGLPTGFYDSTNDFTGWIAGDMSPTELQSRVDLATQASALANPSLKQALRQMGLNDGDIAAYFLDSKKALPLLQKAAATAAVGSEALARGFAFDQQYAENLATEGITREQAAAGYTQIAGELESMKTLGQIYGQEWTQRTSEQEVFEGTAAAQAQKRKLLSQERGSFSGGAGTARGGLAQSGGAR